MSDARAASELPRNLRSLTGLRYLAAAVVLVHHAAERFTPGTPIAQYSELGYIGVTFFFVLSGFVLAWSMKPNGGGRTGAFYQSRFARIYPMYLVAWLVAFAAALLSGGDIPWLAVILTLVLLQAWVPDPNIYGAINPPGWSLSAEAFFYAVFPFLMGRRVRLHERVYLLVPILVGTIAFGVVFSFTPIYSHWFIYYSPIWNLTSFVIGILLAAAIKKGLRVAMPTWAALAIAGGVYFVISTVWPDCPRGFAGAVMLGPLCLVIVSAANNDIARRRSIWSTKALVLLGQWSYALYLVHYLMITKAYALAPEFVLGSTFLSALMIVLLLLAATGVSAVAFYVIERPAQRLLRPKRNVRAHAVTAEVERAG